jgi:glutamate-1-semialdehyde 2,1-aminomutase
MKSFKQSQSCFEQAKQVLVGGVNSPVRAFKAVQGSPLFIKEAKGAYLYCEDGHTYIDYVLAWGPLLFGHAQPDMIQAISEAAVRGTSYGAPNHQETELALLIREFFPSCERLRFVNSGTEATMSAIRLARGATQRKKILKFNGAYHGHVDSLLVQAGSGGLTLGIPDSQGVIPEIAAFTLTAEFNDLEALERAFQEHHRDLAAVIIEPVCGNMGVVAPQPGFLSKLRELCSIHGTLLIFDEVMTGFRVHPGGAQALYHIKPDLTCLAKVIGGGLPCGAYGGRADLMALVAPEGPVYQAGTLSGNPLVMAAGLAMLKRLKQNPHEFTQAAQMTAQLAEGIREILRNKNLPYQVNQVGTLFTLFFTDRPVHNLQDAKRAHVEKFRHFFHGLLEKGIYLAPSQFESNFMSSAHTSTDIAYTLQVIEETLSENLFR